MCWQKFNVLVTNVADNLVLGLLLVSRTNSVYDRFWEGCKAWANLTANIRSLGCLIWVAIAEFCTTVAPDITELIAVNSQEVVVYLATASHLLPGWGIDLPNKSQKAKATKFSIL